MSVLEFIAAIKWPITVILMPIMIATGLKLSPGARRAIGAWLEHRDVRLQLAGNELATTLAETQGSMGLAAGTDSALAETAADAAEPPNDEPNPAAISPEAVEFLRRAAVEHVVNGAVRLGWQWAQQGNPQPEVTVWWTDEGHPSVRFSHPPQVPSPAQAGNEMTLRVPSGTPGEDARAAMRIMLNALGRHADEAVAQQDEMRAAVARRLRRRRRQNDGDDAGITDVQTG